MRRYLSTLESKTPLFLKMKRILKITGIITLSVLFVVLLLGLAVGTIWLFQYIKGKDLSTWARFSVLFEGIGALIFTPIGIIEAILFAKDRIRKINETNNQ